MLEKLYGFIVEHPDRIIIFCVALASLAIIFFRFVRLCIIHRYYDAVPYLAMAISILIILGRGHDFVHHAGRTIWLWERLADGNIDLLVDVNQVPLPIFYFYSTAIYVFSLPFFQFGFGAAQSVAIVAALFFLIMAALSRKLFQELAAINGIEKDIAGAVTIIFLSANYIYLNFILRNAYPEAAAFALVPVVVLSLFRGGVLTAAALIALQISLHPPVFPHALTATILSYLLIARSVFLVACIRVLAVTILGMILSLPAWFWAFANRGEVLGWKGLPVSFEDTFLSLQDVLNPLSHTSPGPYIVALAILVFYFARSIQVRSLVALGAATLILFLQIKALSGFVMQLPLVDIGLFIWRWMFVVVWLATLAVLIAWNKACSSAPFMSKALRCVTVVAGAHVLLASALHLRPPTPDETFSGYMEPTTSVGTWGYGEFYPKAGPPSSECDALLSNDFRQVSFRSLQAGIDKPDSPVAIRYGYSGFVRYFSGNTPIPTVRCDEYLFLQANNVIGDAKFSAELDWIGRHPMLKIFWPLLVLIILVIVLTTSLKVKRWI